MYVLHQAEGLTTYVFPTTFQYFKGKWLDFYPDCISNVPPAVSNPSEPLVLNRRRVHFQFL